MGVVKKGTQHSPAAIAVNYAVLLQAGNLLLHSWWEVQRFAVQVQLRCAGPQPNHLLLCDSFWVEPCLTAQGFVSLHVQEMVM